jgi:transcriptional regulator with XRE-family HTH domain
VTGLRPHIRLRAAREAAGLTQKALADQAGIDRSRYNGLEKGRLPISADTAAQIVAVLNEVDPAEITTPREISLEEIDAFRKEWARLDAWAEDLRNRI